MGLSEQKRKRLPREREGQESAQPKFQGYQDSEMLGEGAEEKAYKLLKFRVGDTVRRAG